VENKELASPREIKKLLQTYNLACHKKWGQNFLIDRNIVNKILQEVGAGPEDYIIEIGPGPGILTGPLVDSGAKVLAVEIDHGMVKILNDFLGTNERLCLVQSDVQKVNLSQLCCFYWGNFPPVKIVANLPYYITSSLLYRLFSREIPWEKAVLMMQKEVAQRLTAPVSSPDYGALTVIGSCSASVTSGFVVSRSVFYPPPKVDSMVITLEPRGFVNYPEVEKDFFELVKRAFAKRRKNIVNALHPLAGKSKEELKETVKYVGVDPGKRAEELTAEEFAKLSRLIYNEKG